MQQIRKSSKSILGMLIISLLLFGLGSCNRSKKIDKTVLTAPSIAIQQGSDDPFRFVTVTGGRTEFDDLCTWSQIGQIGINIPWPGEYLLTARLVKGDFHAVVQIDSEDGAIVEIDFESTVDPEFAPIIIHATLQDGDIIDPSAKVREEDYPADQTWRMLDKHGRHWATLFAWPGGGIGSWNDIFHINPQQPAWELVTDTVPHSCWIAPPTPTPTPTAKPVVSTPTPTPRNCLVTNENDSGPGSLRQVLQDFHNGLCPSPITFAPGVSTIALTSGQLEITLGPLTIDGGVSRVIVSGNNASRVFYVDGSGVEVIFANLNIQDGNAPEGGGIYNNRATITIDSGTTIRNNEATAWVGGGGIYNYYGMLIVDGTVSYNMANFTGGGICSQLGTAIINGTVSYNTAVTGGGIDTYGTLTINGTISHNTAINHGGGIHDPSGAPGISSTSIAPSGQVVFNIADSDGDNFGDGGGVFNGMGTFINNGTISGNTDASPNPANQCHNYYSGGSCVIP